MPSCGRCGSSWCRGASRPLCRSCGAVWRSLLLWWSAVLLLMLCSVGGLLGAAADRWRVSCLVCCGPAMIQRGRGCLRAASAAMDRAGRGLLSCCGVLSPFVSLPQVHSTFPGCLEGDFGRWSAMGLVAHGQKARKKANQQKIREIKKEENYINLLTIRRNTCTIVDEWRENNERCSVYQSIHRQPVRG